MQLKPGSLKEFVRYISNLFSSEYFTDALRITLSIIVPFSAFYYFTDPHTAIAVGIGGLQISLTDSPGTLKDKLIISVSSLCLFFLVTFIVGLLLPYAVVSALLVFVLCMVFSMFTAFGPRYALLGTIILVLMTFVQGLKPADPLWFSLHIFIGGFCYYAISVARSWLLPFSSVRHALGECIMSTADFLKIKAGFYRPESSLGNNYLQIIKLHNKVSEKQEQVRDLLLRDKRLMRPGNAEGKKHLLVISQVIDLYEMISAIQYNYEFLQQSLKDTGLLESISRAIEHLANDFHELGLALYARSRVKPVDSSAHEIELLLKEIEKLIAAEKSVYSSVLKKVHDNIENIYKVIRQINVTLTTKAEEISFPEDLPFQLFTVPKRINLHLIKRHLSLKSPIFRFSLRFSLACMVAYSLMFLPMGFYSYWILLTVIVVVKPGFGLTKKRNIQRIKGSLIGVLVGFLVLLVIGSVTVQLILAGLFLLGSFVYLRQDYGISIMFLTPMVVIALHNYDSTASVELQRALDSIIGCAIAFGASYLFPSWEIKKHSVYIRDVIHANLNYLKKLYDEASGLPSNSTSFKLARKDVYTRLAALSSGVQNMLMEPGQAQEQIQHLYEFQILSHQLFSTVASFFPFSNSNGHLAEIKDKIEEAIHLLERSLDILNHSALQFCREVDDTPKDYLLDVKQHDHVEKHKIQQILHISQEIKNQVCFLNYENKE